jgi:hypothetical protein
MAKAKTTTSPESAPEAFVHAAYRKRGYKGPEAPHQQAIPQAGSALRSRKERTASNGQSRRAWQRAVVEAHRQADIDEASGPLVIDILARPETVHELEKLSKIPVLPATVLEIHALRRDLWALRTRFFNSAQTARDLQWGRTARNACDILQAIHWAIVDTIGAVQLRAGDLRGLPEEVADRADAGVNIQTLADAAVARLDGLGDAARGQLGPRGLTRSGFRRKGDTDEREALFELLVRQVEEGTHEKVVDEDEKRRRTTAGLPPVQGHPAYDIVRSLLIALSHSTVGMGAPGLGEARFAAAIASATGGLGTGQRSKDPSAIVRACFRAIGVKGQLGKRRKQRDYRENVKSAQKRREKHARAAK